MNRFILPFTVSLATFWLFAACSTISTYDQAAYEHATSAKAETLALMDKATNSYSSQAKDITALKLTLDKAYEYDKGRPLNQVTIALWDKLLDPQHDLLGGFLRDWKEDGTESVTAIAEKKKQIGEGFDLISGLESKKIKPADAQESAKKL